MKDHKHAGRRALLKSSVAGLAGAALWPVANATCAENTKKIGIASDSPSRPASNERQGETLQNTSWTCALELGSDRSVSSGSSGALCDAIRRGADLRILTEFIVGEHLDPSSDSTEIVREVCDFQITYLLDDRWAAGIMRLRQPISLPEGFGARPSMSSFLYNPDGEQASARPHLDGRPSTGSFGPAPVPSNSDMPKYHQHFDRHQPTPHHH